MSRNVAAPITALTREEHDALVELLGRPITQRPVGTYRHNGVKTPDADPRPTDGRQ